MFDIEVYHIGSGGIAGSEGSVVLTLEGEPGQVEQAFNFVQSHIGERPLNRPNGTPKQ